MIRELHVAPPLERLVPLFPQLEIDGLVSVDELSAVFRARQTALDRQVALKILPGFVVEDEKLVEAFSADARTMAPLQHPNLVRVFDFGETDGLIWVIQEWIEGRTVREMLAENALEVRQAGELMIQVCRGLEYAHESGVIHGDLRARHIMIDARDRVKLMNFGLGRLVLAEAGPKMPGVVAPELLDPDLEVDQRADIFALGVLLYEMLVGERPVGEVELPSVLRPGVVGPEFDELVVRCLNPSVEDRFQDCLELRKALEKQVKVPPPTGATRPVSPTMPARPVPVNVGLAGAQRKAPSYYPDHDARRPKWPLILGLSALLVLGIWLVKRHYDKIERIAAEHSRKVDEVKEQIAENERKMAESKRRGKTDELPNESSRPADPDPADPIDPPTPADATVESTLPGLEDYRTRLASGERPPLPAGTLHQDGADYYFVADRMTWDEADKLAKSVDAQLPAPTDAGEFAWLTSRISRIEDAECIWLGGRLEEGAWVRPDGSDWQPALTIPSTGERVVLEREGELASGDSPERLPFFIVWQPKAEPESDLPPGDPDLRDRAIGLIEDAREKREGMFADNARSLVFKLGVRARKVELDEAKLIGQLKADVVENRIPIISDVRNLPEELGQIFESAHVEEEKIEGGYLTNLSRIRDAYVTRLERAAAETTDEEPKQRLLAQAERASDIEAWVELLSPEPKIERKRSSGGLGGGFAGRWQIQTDNRTQWIADENGVVTINDGQWKGKTATWKILDDGTLEVHWPDKPRPYTFTRNGDGWIGKTSFGKPATLTPGDW